MAQPVVRAAFDIGSSQHKVVVASVDDSGVHVLYSHAIRVPLADILATQSRQILPQHALDDSRRALRMLRAHAVAAGASEFAAVATQVFRTAHNGLEYLQRLAAEESVRITLVTVAEEGVLAFRAAQVGYPLGSPHYVQRESVVVWDCGGSSLQLTHFDVVSSTHEVLGVPIGSSTVRNAFLSSGACPSSTSQLAKWISDNATPLSPQLEQKLALRHVAVVGIGGQTSMFSIVAAHKRHSEFFLADVRRAISDEIRFARDYSKTLPKLVLLAEVMKLYKIQKVRHVASNGSCIGLLTTCSSRLWRPRANAGLHTDTLDTLLLEDAVHGELPAASGTSQCYNLSGL